MAALAELNRLPRICASRLDRKLSPFNSRPPPLDGPDDDDWEAQITLAEQEAMDVDQDEVDMDALRELEEQEREANGSGRGGEGGKTPEGVDTGKSRMVFEEDDDFGAFETEEVVPSSSAARPPAKATTTTASTSLSTSARSHTHDYSSRFGAVANLDLSAPKPSGWIEAAPLQATRLDGKMLFLRRRKRVEGWVGNGATTKQDTLALSSLASSMLEQPYHQIMKEIEEDKKRVEKNKAVDAGNPVLDPAAGGTTPVETQLWTDRYRPKRFVDLLGDERLHRTALLWLKEWDACVFKGTDKANAAAEMKRERSKKRAREGGGGGEGFGGKEGGASGAARGGNGWEEAAPDPYGRPQEKVLLLSGPPGLGKTTLAHVLARQAGYQVLEINASDDRSGKVVEERVRNALESGALTTGFSAAEKGKGKGREGGTKRPTCVVIDEVDGAGGGGESSFVKTLVKLITEGSSTRKPSKKGKGKQPRQLLRPIICICNDLYAPVLRPLRPLAKIVRFSPPTPAMLVKRLRTICDAEELVTENKHLSTLVDTVEGDLRSCLNTLQFIKRNNSTVHTASIRGSTIGSKDTGTSSSQVLDRLFKKPPRKRGAPAAEGVGADEKYVNRIVRDVQTSGEYEKISQGCFENYLLAHGSNAESFPKLQSALDWLFLYDQLDSRLRSEREYELLAYVPYAFAPWYHLFSSATPKPVENPKTDYEMYLKRTAHQEVADAFVFNIPYSLRAMFTGTNVVAELLPLLNRIVSPDLKPVSSTVVKNDERRQLMRLVNTMITTNMAFVLDKAEDGQLSYKIDPPIDVFVHFEGKRAADIAPGRFAVRQMINREIDTEVLHRTNEEGKSNLKSASDILGAYKVKPAAAPVVETKQAVDFFGRAIVTGGGPAEGGAESTATAATVPPPPKRQRQAMYRFNEGFSNAVRVTKRVADFLA
ncbi:hypothetical protein JCM8547_002120 [Rhodosporidiobolus lusitaniae]